MLSEIAKKYVTALERSATLTPESYEEFYKRHQEKNLEWDDNQVVIEEINRWNRD